MRSAPASRNVPVYEAGHLADKRRFLHELVKGRTLSELLAEVETGSACLGFLSIFEAIVRPWPMPAEG